MSQRQFQFLQRANFHFDDLRTTAVAHSPLQSRNDVARQGGVIILDEHPVGKIEPMILSSAAAYRVLIDHAQAGCGLARIQNARLGARDLFHEFASQGRDSAHALQEI